MKTSITCKTSLRKPRQNLPRFQFLLYGRLSWQPLLAALFYSLGTGPGHASPEPGKLLKVTTRDEGGFLHFYVQNLEAADVTATFNMHMTNLEGSIKFPYTATFPGNQTVEAFMLAPIKRDVPWDYSYTDAFTIGSLTAIHDDTAVYALPYAPGASV